MNSGFLEKRVLRFSQFNNLERALVLPRLINGKNWRTLCINLKFMRLFWHSFWEAFGATAGVLAGLSIIPVVLILASLAFRGRAKKYLEEYNRQKANNEAEKNDTAKNNPQA